MKFRKFGKALLMSALSLGAVFSVTSCVQSYTVGFLYVTGLQTGGSQGQGIISGFKIDHNTGKLTNIHGMPISSGGSNPERAVLLTGSRFLYVLNKGNGTCTTDQTAQCTQGSTIVQFAIGGNGDLSQQETFYTQGYNPFRMFADATGAHLYVLDHDVPSSSSCALALGSGVTACADISAFNIDSATGRLSVLENAQVTSASGQPLPYFPVPANPIDFVLSNNIVLTLSGTSSAGDSVFPYAYSLATGQLTITQNSSQPLNIFQATAIQAGNASVYVLDDEPLTIGSGTSSTFTAGTYTSQLLPFTANGTGALQAQSGGAVPDTQTQTEPLFVLVESGGKWAYVANYGNNANTNNAGSGIAGFVIDKATNQLTFMSGSPFNTGSGPRCLVEDPSSNFIYTANYNDSTVTGQTLDHNEGVLKPLNGNANKAYPLPGPATYCLINGRTS